MDLKIGIIWLVASVVAPHRTKGLERAELRKSRQLKQAQASLLPIMLEPHFRHILSSFQWLLGDICEYFHLRRSSLTVTAI